MELLANIPLLREGVSGLIAVGAVAFLLTRVLRRVEALLDSASAVVAAWSRFRRTLRDARLVRGAGGGGGDTTEPQAGRPGGSADAAGGR